MSITMSMLSFLICPDRLGPVSQEQLVPLTHRILPSSQSQQGKWLVKESVRPQSGCQALHLGHRNIGRFAATNVSISKVKGYVICTCTLNKSNTSIPCLGVFSQTQKMLLDLVSRQMQIVKIHGPIRWTLCNVGWWHQTEEEPSPFSLALSQDLRFHDEDVMTPFPQRPIGALAVEKEKKRQDITEDISTVQDTLTMKLTVCVRDLFYFYFVYQLSTGSSLQAVK